MYELRSASAASDQKTYGAYPSTFKRESVCVCVSRGSVIYTKSISCIDSARSGLEWTPPLQLHTRHATIEEN